MFSRTRVLLVAIVVALFAWMLGYGMGGGFRISGKGAADSRDEDAARGSGAAGRKAGLHVGTAHTAEDTLSDQIAARRIPWTRERLLKTVGSIHHEPDQLHAIRFWMKLTEQFGVEDFPLALDALDDAIKGTGKPGYSNENDGVRKKLREFAIMRWAELKPEAAAEYVRALPYESFNRKREDIAALCGVWTISDPTAALAWAKKLPNDNSERWDASDIVMKATARRDLDGALALARANPDLISRACDAITEAVGDRDAERIARTMADLGDPVAIMKAAGTWEKKDHDAALKWAQELPEGNLRTFALKGVWTQFALFHPKEAAAWISEHPADGPSYLEPSAWNIMIKTLSSEDIGKATEWAASLKQPDARNQAIWELAQCYGADRNFDAGLKWLDTLSAGEVRDRAVYNFVSENSNRRDRFEVATTIEDPEIRLRTLSDAFQGCSSGREADAAREWIETSPKLSEEDRQAILKKK